MRKFLSANVTTILLVGFALLMLFSPDAKGWLIQRMMSIGLFQPNISAHKLTENPSPLPPDVLFQDGNKQVVSLQQLKGKVLFINFWATWCPPCRAEMPSIEHLYQKMKTNENVVFLMVDVDGNYKKSAKYMKNKGFSLPVYTPASQIPKEILSGSIPTTIIVDKKGQLVFHEEGAGDYSGKNVTAYLEKLAIE